MKKVLILSGGTDSTTLLYELLQTSPNVYPITFYYGQKHQREIEAAGNTCEALGVTHKIVDIEFFGNELAPSSLTRGEIEVPHGHYEKESMKKTVVPNRNMVLLSLAASYAIGIGAGQLFYGAHSGNHAIYPDCRPEFVKAMAKAFKLCDWSELRLEAPYLNLTKGDIVSRGVALGVDYSSTWSCYQGLDKPCKKCGSCVERAEAFKFAGVEDPLLK